METSLIMKGAGTSLDVNYNTPIALDDGWNCVVGLVSLDASWESSPSNSTSKIIVYKGKNDRFSYTPPDQLKFGWIGSADKLHAANQHTKVQENGLSNTPSNTSDSFSNSSINAHPPPKNNAVNSTTESSIPPSTTTTKIDTTTDKSNSNNSATPQPTYVVGGIPDGAEYITLPPDLYTIKQMEFEINKQLLAKHGNGAVHAQLNYNYAGTVTFYCTRAFTFGPAYSFQEDLGFSGENDVLAAGEWHPSRLTIVTKYKIRIESGLNDRFYYFPSRTEGKSTKHGVKRGAEGDGLIKTIVIPQGKYTVSEINDLINGKSEGGADFTLYTDEKTRRIMITSNSLIDFSASDSIGPSLGFPADVFSPFKRHSSDVMEDYFKVTEKYVHVTCNIAGGSYINDLLSHSIFSFKIVPEKSYKLNLAPINILYFPIKRHRITHIRLSFYDEEDNPIFFEKIRIHLHLKHFKKHGSHI
jgi:hypothetical protein